MLFRALRPWKRFAAASAVSLTLVTTVGAQAAVDLQAAPAKPTLTIGMITTPITLDPAKDGSGPWNTVRHLAYEGLTRAHPNGSISPGLAQSYRYLGKGNKNFELTLRRNARFADGAPVTAAAVKSWLEYFAQAKGGNIPALGPIRSIETVGRWTVRIHLRSPNPMIPRALTSELCWGAVASPNAVSNPSLLGTRTFGAGPYALVPSQSVTNSHYTFVPNKFYYDKSAIRYSKVVVRVITSPASMLRAAQTGQVDVAIGQASTADAAASAGLSVVRAQYGAVGLGFQDRAGTIEKALGDVRVRQALNYAIDRKAISEAVVGRYGEPTSQVRTIDGYDPKLDNYYSYNPERARTLLAQAGYRNGFSLTILDTPAGGVNAVGWVSGLAKYFGEIGVKVNVISPATAGEWASRLFSGSVPAFINPRGGDPMWLYYGLYLGPKATLNSSHASDPAINRLWLSGQRAENPTPFWKQMSARTVTQAMFVNISTFPTVYYVSKRVRGVAVSSSLPTPDSTAWAPR